MLSAQNSSLIEHYAEHTPRGQDFDTGQSNNVLSTGSYHEWCRSSNFSGGTDRKQLEAEIRL
jgi:hypothetical protein